MWARPAWLLPLLLLVGCGARSDLSAPDADVDAREELALAPELVDTWFFPLASGAPRYYVLALCPDGRAGLRTSFLGEGGPDPGEALWGRVRPSSGDIDAVASFDPAAAPMGFSTMRLRYDRATDTLLWLDEVDVFSGWASGGGLRYRYDWIPASSVPSCE